MSEIEEIREKQEGRTISTRWYDLSIRTLLAEIDRLTKENEIWREKKKMLENDLAKAWEENAKLKAILREAAKENQGR